MKTKWIVQNNFNVSLFRHTDYYYACIMYVSKLETIFVGKVVYRGVHPRNSKILLAAIHKCIRVWLLKHKLSAKTLEEVSRHIIEINSVQEATDFLAKTQEAIHIASTIGGMRHVFLKAKRPPFDYVNIRFNLK